MGRLYCVQLHTPDVDRQQAFYHERLGLESAHAEGGRVVFASRGAALVLVPAAAGEAAELRIALETPALAERIAALKTRGAKFEGEIAEDAMCRRCVLRDPEGNRVELVEPRAALPAGKWPVLSHVIVNAAKFDDTVAFYRELLGLKLGEKDETWVTFDTGETKLAVHDREESERLALHADQRIAFALEDSDFDAWTEELRERGVSFATAPAETALGPLAEVEDADGWFVLVRGPLPEEPLDDEALASEFGDGDDEPHGLPRRGGDSGGDGSRRVLPAAKLARKQAARASKAPAPELERGGFVPRSGYSGSRPGSSGPRPGGSGPRPFPPREGGPPRPFTPREGGPSRPFTPREGGPSRPFTPREGGPSRPFTPRDSGSRPPSPGGPPRPPQGPPRPDRDRTE